jgi:hypothetical protein
VHRLFAPEPFEKATQLPSPSLPGAHRGKMPKSTGKGCSMGAAFMLQKSAGFADRTLLQI